MATAEELVVLAVQPVHAPLGGELSAACDRARVRCMPWSDSASTAGLEGRAPALLMAELPPGERRIPQSVVALMTRTFPDAPLLLLCNEQLNRPAVSLQNGRVTLMGPPLTAQRISSRIRVLTAGHAGESARGRLVATEHLGSHWWVAGLTTSDAPAKLGPAVLRQSPAEGLTALVPVEPGAAPADADLARIAALVSKEESHEEKEKALAKSLGAKIGLVHLGPGAKRWVLYWPAETAQLSIYSPVRLPAYWDVSDSMRKAGTRMVRLGASGGDLVCALSIAVGGNGRSEIERTALAGAMAEGGPAVLDLFENRLRQSPAPLSGILAEVR